MSQLPTPPMGQELLALSQESPVLTQCGPRILGDTSPRFDEAKAATYGPCQKKQPIACHSFLLPVMNSVKTANIPSTLVNSSNPFECNRRRRHKILRKFLKKFALQSAYLVSLTIFQRSIQLFQVGQFQPTNRNSLTRNAAYNNTL